MSRIKKPEVGDVVRFHCVLHDEIREGVVYWVGASQFSMNGPTGRTDMVLFKQNWEVIDKRKF